jgi:hypothetical protein
MGQVFAPLSTDDYSIDLHLTIRLCKQNRRRGLPGLLCLITPGSADLAVELAEYSDFR